MRSNTFLKLILILLSTLLVACGSGGNNTNAGTENTSTDDNTSNNDTVNNNNQNQTSSYNPYSLSSSGNTRLKKITTENSSTDFYYEAKPVTPKLVKTVFQGPEEDSTAIFEYKSVGFRLSKIVTDEIDKDGITTHIEMTTGSAGPNGPKYAPINDNAISIGDITGSSCKEFSGTYTYAYQISSGNSIQSQADILSKTINMTNGVVQKGDKCEDTAYTVKDTYTYDDLGRLTKETTSIDENELSSDTYEYDSYHRVTRILTSLVGLGNTIKKEYKYVTEPIGSFKIAHEKEYSYYDSNRDGSKEWNLIKTSLYTYEDEECYTRYTPFEPTDIPFLKSTCF